MNPATNTTRSTPANMIYPLYCSMKVANVLDSLMYKASEGSCLFSSLNAFIMFMSILNSLG